MALLALIWHGAPAYGAAAPPIFFTQAQYQNSLARNQLEPGSLASCTVPNVTITHSPHYVVPTTAPQMVFANLTATPHAVCNDGSPAVFLFRKGFGAAASRWVIYLDGGAECYDQASCMQRQANYENLISSVPYSTGSEAFTPLPGILSPDPAQNPDFFDANLVQISYCSSDLWMGEKDGNESMNPAQIRASGNVANWYFDGHGVVAGVIQILQQSFGLKNATDVLLAGGSAGGAGVFMNANFVAGLLALQTRFVALSDSGYTLSSYPDYDATTGGNAPLPTNNQAVMQDGQSLWAAIGDFDCAYTSNHTANGANNLGCDYPDKLAQNGTYRMPIFIRSSYVDAVILQNYNIIQPVTSQAQPYVTNFGNAMAQSLNSVNLWLSVFGLNSSIHTMVKDPSFTNLSYTFPKTAPSTLAAAIGVWYRKPCPAPRWMQSTTQ